MEVFLREDLYYRLKVIPIVLPPLRERRDDILPLAQFFVDEFNREFKKNVRGLAKETERAFLEYAWPGNVRELRNVSERAMILESEETILPGSHLPSEFAAEAPETAPQADVQFTLPAAGLDIEDVEKELIRQALEKAKWNQTKAARLLNLTRDALRYRMQKFGFLQEKGAAGSENTV